MDAVYIVCFQVTVHFACMYSFHLILNSLVPPLYLPLASREKPWPYSFYPWVVQHVGYHLLLCLHFVLVFIPSHAQTSWWQKHKTVTISAFLCLLMNCKNTNISSSAINVSSMVILCPFIQDKSMMAATERSPIHKNVLSFRSGTGRWLSSLWFPLTRWVSLEWVGCSRSSAVVHVGRCKFWTLL